MHHQKTEFRAFSTFAIHALHVAYVGACALYSSSLARVSTSLCMFLLELKIDYLSTFHNLPASVDSRACQSGAR